MRENPISRQRRKSVKTGAGILAVGIGMLVLAIVGMKLAHTIFVWAWIIAFVGIGASFLFFFSKVDASDVASLRKNAAEARGKGNSEEAARLEQEADELEAALNGL